MKETTVRKIVFLAAQTLWMNSWETDFYNCFWLFKISAKESMTFFATANSCHITPSWQGSARNKLKSLFKWLKTSGIRQTATILCSRWQHKTLQKLSIGKTIWLFNTITITRKLPLNNWTACFTNWTNLKFISCWMKTKS